MKINKILGGVILSLLLIASISLFANIRTHAQEQGVDLSTISAKLDQILNGQKAIADQVASIRQELNIVKIRVTQIQ